MANNRRAQYGVKRRGDRWTARPYVPGRGHIWAGTFDSEQEAVRAAIEKVEEERRLPAHKETVESFCRRWIKDFSRPKESSNDKYRAAAAAFAREFGLHKLHEITVPDAMVYGKQHRHDIGALRAMFSDARRIGLVLSNPFSALGISKGRGRKDIVAITEEELGTLTALARAAHPGEFGERFAALIEVAAWATPRPAELCGFDRIDVDFKTAELHIRRQFHKRRITTPKNDEPRTIDLHPRAVQALRAMPRRVPRPVCPVTGNEILFPGKRGQRLTQPALSLAWKPVRVAFEATLDPARLAEFRAGRNPRHPQMDFYELRHFGATYLVEQGVESWIVARQLGHKDGGRLVEQTYGHPSDRVAREKLRRVFKQNVQPLRAVDDAEEATG